MNVPKRHFSSVGILFNPISGGGRSARTAGLFKKALESAGLEVQMLQSAPSYDRSTEFTAFLHSAELIVVCGGDGTLMKVLGPLAEAGKPVYMTPGGNESLFSKYFSMTNRPEDLLRAISKACITSHYFGLVNGTPFFTMASIGLDSKVVETIARSRCGPLGYIGYIRPLLTRIFGHQAPCITLRVDEKEVVKQQNGFLIISNTPRYACRLPLVPEAESTVPTLCARFMPYTHVLHYLPLAIAACARREAFLKNTRLFEGRRFEVATSESYPVQADGDYIGSTPAVLELAAKRLQVLTP